MICCNISSMPSNCCKPTPMIIPTFDDRVKAYQYVLAQVIVNAPGNCFMCPVLRSWHTHNIEYIDVRSFKVDLKELYPEFYMSEPINTWTTSRIEDPYWYPPNNRDARITHMIRLIDQMLINKVPSEENKLEN